MCQRYAIPLLLFAALGCARVYRPVSLAPSQPPVQNADLAGSLVLQRAGTYFIYPLLPGVLAVGASSKGSFGPSDQTAFLALALVGACIGMPNAAVAARSNHRLETFFQDAAWTPGTLEPGRVSRGLVFFRSRDPGAPLPVEVSYRIGDRQGQLPLICPGWARGGKSGRR